LLLKSERLITFLRPSAAQNLPKAKGKSLEILRTTVFSKEFKSALKCLAEAAQTPVSILGKMLRTTFFPAKSERDFSDKSSATM